MYPQTDRHRRVNPNHRHYDTPHRRFMGGKVLNRANVNVLVGERQTQLAQELRKDALDTMYSHLHELSEESRRETGRPLPVNADGIRTAYIAQTARLRDKQATSHMTPRQLTSEYMAKAILFSPQASDALVTRRHHESKATLSRYNDTIGEIAGSLPEHMEPGYKVAVVDALKAGSRDLNDRIGHSSEIADKDPESGIDEIWTIMNGEQDEIAPENALKDDPSLELIVPQDTASDLVGIDMQVKRLSDGKLINIDTKSHGKYLSTVAKKTHVDWVDESATGPYYFVGIHENGYPHYLLNASAFGEIPDDGFEYTPEGQEQLRRTVHEMLDSH